MMLNMFFIDQEYASGYYRVATFFIAKLICDVLPMRIIPSIIFSLIAYFMTGLQRTAGQFFTFLITIFMASVFGSALCFFISAAIPVFSKPFFRSLVDTSMRILFSGCIDCCRSNLRYHDGLHRFLS